MCVCIHVNPRWAILGVWHSEKNRRKKKLPECHKKQIPLAHPPPPCEPQRHTEKKTETKQKLSSHEYANISQRSECLFEELLLLFLAINSANNCSLSFPAVSLLLSVCVSFSRGL